jgi:phage gp37-like protein
MLQEDHSQIRGMIEEARAVIDRPGQTGPQAITELRWRFDRAITRHIFALTTEVARWVQRVQPDAEEAVATLIDAARAIQFAYETHKERYQELTIGGAWDDYAQSANGLMVAIERLLTEEQAQLFPKMGREELRCDEQ